MSCPPHGEPALSIVIPARDEEGLIAETLSSLRVALEALGQPTEVIVVDDGSTDRTAAIALEHGARVIPVSIHNIGAVRNAGAREARGDIVIFLDADTRLPAETLRAAWDAMASGAVGGGAWVQFDEQTSRGQRLVSSLFCFAWERLFGWAAGCFIFTRREDFVAVGGFDQQYFAAEERFLSEALRTRSVRHPPATCDHVGPQAAPVFAAATPANRSSHAADRARPSPPARGAGDPLRRTA